MKSLILILALTLASCGKSSMDTRPLAEPGQQETPLYSESDLCKQSCEIEHGKCVKLAIEKSYNLNLSEPLRLREVENRKRTCVSQKESCNTLCETQD